MPPDTRERVRLIEALTASERLGFRVLDDGEFVTLRILLAVDRDDLHERLLRIAADVRCLGHGGRPVLEARFLRDGRQEPTDLRVGPTEPWPAGTAAIAVDFHDTGECTTERFEDLLAMAEAARLGGRGVYFLHTPPHLRLHAEVCLGHRLLPINRKRVGPRLPDVLSMSRR